MAIKRQTEGVGMGLCSPPCVSRDMFGARPRPRPRPQDQRSLGLGIVLLAGETLKGLDNMMIDKEYIISR